MKHYLLSVLAKDAEEIINSITDKAAIVLSDQALPLNFFNNPGIQFLLDEMSEFRVETSKFLFKSLTKKLASRKTLTSRVEDLSERFTKVSKLILNRIRRTLIGLIGPDTNSHHMRHIDYVVMITL